MNPLIQLIQSDVLHEVLFAILAIFACAFAGMVFGYGIFLALRLNSLAKAIRRLGSQPMPGVKRQLTSLFTKTRWKNHWQEYEETLHDVKELDGIEERVVEVRATVPADSFFHIEALVDGPLHTEFFKHLPGILTGIGIIATFSGLIEGLQHFDASATDPEALKTSLGGLFGYVRKAFLFSAIAIGMAMAVTVIEKIIYAICVHKGTLLAMELDRLFRAGLGEEYLSKLVHSSEQGASQTRQLKESLVEDLKSLLTNLTERQIQATQQLSTDIGQSLQKSLEAPLQQFADIVKTNTSDQSNQSAKVLEDLMAAFLARMQESMGGQMGNLSALMQQTSEAIVKVEASLRGLVDDMQRTSEHSASGMQAAMQSLIRGLAEHQAEQSNAASEANARVLAQVQESVDQMSRAQAAATSQSQQAAISATQQIGQAAAASVTAGENATRAAQELLEGISRVSSDTIQSLENGAAKIASSMQAMGAVTDRLIESGHTLATLQDKAGEAGRVIERATTGLTASVATSSQAMANLAKASAQLEAASNVVATEAQFRESTLREIQNVLTHAKDSSAQFSRLAEEVAQHLASGVSKFGTATSDVLNRTLVEYDKSLSGSVAVLRDIIDELASNADSVRAGARA